MALCDDVYADAWGSAADVEAACLRSAGGARGVRSEPTTGSLVGALGGRTDLFDLAAGPVGGRLGRLAEGFGQVLDVGLQDTLEEVGDARRGAVALCRQGVGQMVERGVALRGASAWLPPRGRWRSIPSSYRGCSYPEFLTTAFPRTFRSWMTT